MSSAMFGESSLRELLSYRAYWRWALATQLLRLPTFMASIAYVLVSIELLGGPSVGGLLLTVMFVTFEFSAPFAGRLVDRLGVAKWAPRLLMLTAVGRLLLAGAFAIDAPVWALVVIVAVFAALGSGAGGIVRVMLGRTVPERMLARALAVDATLVEFVVIGAPFLVALAALAGGLSPLVVMALFTAAGAALLWTLGRGASGRPEPDAQPGPAGQAPGGPDGAAAAGAPEGAAAAGGPEGAAAARRSRSRSIWRNPQYVFWVLVAFAFGHVLGTAEIGALPAALELGGDNLIGAALVATLAGGSALTGMLYAWLGAKIKLGYRAQTAVLLGCMTASAVVIALPAGWLVIFAGFFALGLCTSPINTVRSYAAGLALPKDRQVEGFAAIDAANGLGFALAGLLLTLLPLSAMLGAGVVMPLVALVLLPVLLLRRPDRGDDRAPQPQTEPVPTAASSDR